MKFYWFFLNLLALSSVCWSQEQPMDQIVRRGYAHLTIKDYFSAISELENGLRLFPQSKEIWKTYIKALALSQQDQKLLANWEKFVHQFPEESQNHEMIEWVAWSVIEKLSVSSSPLVRCMAVLAAFYAQDAQGVEIIHKALYDNNSAVRGIAVELAAQLGDDKLKDDIRKLFVSEKNWDVRLEVIRALGQMKMKESKKDLLNMLTRDKHSDEEKLCAIESLVLLYENPTDEQVRFLAQSQRAALRELACEIVGEYDLEHLFPYIEPLLDDHHADVRAAALETCAWLKLTDLSPLIEKKLKDPDYHVAIRAAWLLIISGNDQGYAAIRDWLRHPLQEANLLAAAVLNVCGTKAYPLNIQMFEEATDPFVKMNLGLGLIGQRIYQQKACEGIYRIFMENKSKWMWKEDKGLRFLAQSKASSHPQIPQYPEVLNQTTRLEVLNVLGVLRYPETETAIKEFLKEKHWGISLLASSLLLTEGDESIIDILHQLLENSEPAIKVQIALVLAQWGKEEYALDILEKAYQQSDREQKEKILEGMIQVASQRSIPFLLKCLNEPYTTIKIIAALGLIRCIYN